MGFMRGMAIFVEYPALAAAVGVLLLGLGVRRRRRIAIGAGIAWLLYAIYEEGMKQRWLCTGECDIRIDLLVIYPALLIAVVVAVASLIRGTRMTPPRA